MKIRLVENKSISMGTRLTCVISIIVGTLLMISETSTILGVILILVGILFSVEIEVEK